MWELLNMVLLYLQLICLREMIIISGFKREKRNKIFPAELVIDQSPSHMPIHSNTLISVKFYNTGTTTNVDRMYSLKTWPFDNILNRA